MKIAVVAHPDRPAAWDLARRMVDRAQEFSVEVVAEKPDAERLQVPAANFAEGSDLDMVLAIGGDGTVLRAVRLSLPSQAPIFGVNTGRLGFLAEGEPDDLSAIIGRLVEGHYQTMDRMVLSVHMAGMTGVALNDVVLERVESKRTVVLKASADGEEFVTYRADGVIVATPTGSTAYSLSAGGPLVDPALEALILTPVAPHSLFSRSLVFPPNCRLQFEVGDFQPVTVTADGEEIGRSQPGDTISVTAGGQVRFVTLAARSFPSTLKRKFHLR